MYTKTLDRPQVDTLNDSLAEEARDQRQTADLAYRKLLAAVDVLTQQSQCEHKFEQATDECMVELRYERTVYWYCPKCKYSQLKK